MKRQSITIDVVDIRRRIVALMLLTSIAIAGVAGWQLPAPRRPSAAAPLAVAGHIDTHSPSGVAVINSRRRGFTLLSAHERFVGTSKSELLHSDSEAKVRGMVARLNQSINLPVEIAISFEDCHDSEVYYDEQNHHVVICHEWLDQMERLVARRTTDKRLVHEGSIS